MTRENLNHCLALLVFTLGNHVSANSLSSYGWDISTKALLATQATENVALLPKTIEKTKAAACTFEKELPISGVKRMLMVRISSGHEIVMGYESIWLLHRTDERAVVTEVLMAASDRVFATHSREVRIRNWDAIFEKFLMHQQRPPTPPLEAGQPMLPGRFWPRGYSGVANTFDNGEVRTYLLATDDIWSLHIQGPIQQMLCGTVFSGLHCRVGAEVNDGWVKQDLESLLGRNPATIHTTTKTKDFVARIHEDCLHK